MGSGFEHGMRTSCHCPSLLVDFLNTLFGETSWGAIAALSDGWGFPPFGNEDFPWSGLGGDKKPGASTTRMIFQTCLAQSRHLCKHLILGRFVSMIYSEFD